MGILGLNDLLRSEYPAVFVRTDIKALCGYIIAVDISVFLYKYIRSYGEPYWIRSMIQLLCTLKGVGIKTIIIFDGPNQPSEKAIEQRRRREESAKIKKKHDDSIILRKALEEYLLSDKDVPSQKQEEIKGLLGRRKIGIDANLSEVTTCMNVLSELAEKIEKQILSVNSQHQTITMEILDALGLPYIQAEGEAETLCSYLAVHRKVDGILSEDTDILAYAAPLMISKFDGASKQVTLVRHNDVLYGLGLSEEEFRDLCIMMSCDYNERCKMPTQKGKFIGIGPKRAYDLIMHYKSIDEISKSTEIDVTCLNHIRCRELLSVPLTYPRSTIPVCKGLNHSSLKDLADRHNVRIDWDHISEVYKPVKMILDDE